MRFYPGSERGEAQRLVTNSALGLVRAYIIYRRAICIVPLPLKKSGYTEVAYADDLNSSRRSNPKAAGTISLDSSRK